MNEKMTLEMSVQEFELDAELVESKIEFLDKIMEK